MDRQITNATQKFWDSAPCGSETSQAKPATIAFFEEVANYRYEEESYIPQFAQFDAFRGRRLLEIGVGLGTDHSRFAGAGAVTVGIDLSLKSLHFAKKRFALDGLKGSFLQTTAAALPFADETFDAVYSHGVLHHIPDIESVLKEIERVLRPGGKFLIAVYHKHSLCYYWNILLINGLLKGKLFYQPLSRVIAYFTDGEGNPYSRLYGRHELTQLLKTHGLEPLEVNTYYVSHRLLFAPLGKYIRRAALPRWIIHILEKLGSRWGWMLTAHCVKK